MGSFGPRPVFFLLPLAAAAFVAAFFLVKPDIRFVGAALVLVLASVPGWSWYRVDAEGVHRSGLSGAKHVPGDRIAGVYGSRLVNPKSGSDVLMQ